VLWVSNVFIGHTLLEESFGLAIEFTSNISLDKFMLVNIYGPYDGLERENFVAWLFHLNIIDDHLWLLVGDF
jgi:hypothetical protein